MPEAITKAADKTYYEELAYRFENAKRPDFETQLKGWTSGRCFSSTKPNTPSANILIATARRNSSAGPLFDKFKLSKAVIYWMHGQPADYYDHLTPELREAITDSENKLFFDKDDSPIMVLENSLVSYLNNKTITNEFRADQDYIYALYTDNNNSRAMCYFFKKVK